MSSLVPLNCDLRCFALADRQALTTAIDRVCAEGRWMETPHYEPTPAWEHALSRPDCPFHLLLVMLDRDKIVGWCRAFPKDSDHAATIGVGLLDEYRNQGLGTYLLRETIQWADRSGFTRLELTTWPDNTRAIHIFEKLGFVSTTRMKQGQIEMMCYLGNMDHHKEVAS